MQLLLTAVRDDKHKVLTWFHVCQPRFAGDHQSKSNMRLNSSVMFYIDLNRLTTRSEAVSYFFYKGGFKAGQVRQCQGSHYHLDILVCVTDFICKNHRVEIFMMPE